MIGNNHISTKIKLEQRSPEAVIREKIPEILDQEQEREVEQIMARRENLEGKDRVSLYKDGSYERSVTSIFGTVEYEQQKLRGVSYVAFGLDKYQRRTPELKELFEYCYLSGMSTREIEELSKILKAKTSRTTVSRINKEYNNCVDQVNHSDLSGKKYLALFIDGKYHGVRVDGTERGHVEDRCIIPILALNEETGKLELIHMGLYKHENNRTYEKIFESLVRRGLETPPIIGISDGQRGLTKSFCDFFSLSYDQVCGFHKLKNILKDLYKPEYAPFRESVVKVLRSQGKDREEALETLEHFRSKLFDWRIDKLLKGLDTSTLPEILASIESNHKLFTSNCIERLNGDLEQRLAGMFALPNEEALLSLCVKRALRYLERNGKEFMPGEDLAKIREEYTLIRECIEGLITETLEEEAPSSELSDVETPMLSLNVEQMAFEHDESILQTKFLTARTQTPEANKRQLIGVYPIFDSRSDHYKIALEDLLERGLCAENLRLIECPQDQPFLCEAAGEVFGEGLIQLDSDLLAEDVLKTLPEKYKEPFEVCYRALIEETDLETAKMLQESLSLSLHLHNVYESSQIFDQYSSQLLRVKELGFKYPGELRSMKDSRINLPTRRLDSLEDPTAATRTLMGKLSRASHPRKQWLNQADVDILFKAIS